MGQIRVLVCVAALLFGIGQIGSLQAQQAPPSGQPSAQQPAPPGTETVTSADVTDLEIEQFAKSYQEVTQIQKDTEKQLESVQDGADIARAKQNANGKMAEAVQNHGMKVERFNQIARSLSQDPTLKQRIQQKIEELRQPA
jgi:hypothetical protein